MRASLHTLLQPGGSVHLRKMTVDRYGRTIAEVFRGSLNINLALVRDGQAFVYRDDLQNGDRNTDLAGEQQAAQNRKGIWEITGGISRPWDWRRGHTSASNGTGRAIPVGTRPARAGSAAAVSAPGAAPRSYCAKTIAISLARWR